MSSNEPTSDEHRSPYVANQTAHPWRRMVSIGDSFTEGIGDPIPGTTLHRGWADRVAEVLGSHVDDFA
ncbi:MAG: SGNH/GDSL hydrolase family protein, partial [Microbacterium sp.]